MTTASPNRPVSVWNIANQLTMARLVLSIVVFVLMSLAYYWAAMWCFLVAVSTDWLDGYFARKYHLVTPLGRMLDPFVDKIIICGTFIYLAAVPGSQIAAWMAVVVVGRELLVTALRSFLEQQGRDFSATMSGKLKMVLQSAAVVASLVLLALGSRGTPALLWTTGALAYAAVAMTVYSGAGYLHRAWQLARG